jgi:HEPN domain-containing protein
VAVLAEHDMELERPMAVEPARGVSVWTMDADGINSLPAGNRTIYVGASATPPVSLDVIKLVLRLMMEGRVVAPEHQLLTRARAALRRGRYRAAVLDAATAAELALTRVLDEGLAPLQEPLRRALIAQPPTLGRLCRLAGKIVPLPQNLQDDLVKPRNGAMHRNEIPSSNEARVAVAVAKQIVLLVEPLPAA